MTGFPPWSFSLFTVMVILWLTLMPDPLGDDAPTLFPGADKIVHGLMFGFLTIVVLLDYQRRRGWRNLRWNIVWIVIFLTSAFGALIEVFQLIMALGRGFEWADMIADTTGAIICGVTWKYLQPAWSRN